MYVYVPRAGTPVEYSSWVEGCMRNVWFPGWSSEAYVCLRERFYQLAWFEAIKCGPFVHPGVVDEQDRPRHHGTESWSWKGAEDHEGSCALYPWALRSSGLSQEHLDWVGRVAEADALKKALGIPKGKPLTVDFCKNRVAKGGTDELTMRCFFLVLFNRLLFPSGNWNTNNSWYFFLECLFCWGCIFMHILWRYLCVWCAVIFCVGVAFLENLNGQWCLWFIFMHPVCTFVCTCFLCMHLDVYQSVWFFVLKVPFGNFKWPMI